MGLHCPQHFIINFIALTFHHFHCPQNFIVKSQILLSPLFPIFIADNRRELKNILWTRLAKENLFFQTRPFVLSQHIIWDVPSVNSEVPLLVVLVVLDLLAQTLFEHITSGPICKYEASLGSSRAFLVTDLIFSIMLPFIFWLLGFKCVLLVK